MKKFEEIYERILQNCNELEKEAKGRRVKSFGITILLVLLNIVVFIFAKKIMEINAFLFMLIPFVSTFIIVYLALKNYKYYRIRYKDEIISRIIKEYDSKLYYEKNYGISMGEYKKADFDRDINQFKTEDRIHGRLLGKYEFQMAEVAAYKEYYTTGPDNKPEKNKVLKFYGIFGSVSLDKDIFSTISVLSNYYANMYKENRIEMESSEFEKNYDLISKEKITALKIFNPELIEKFNEIKRVSPKNNFELKIVNDTIYFRYSCKSGLFEPPQIGLGIDKEYLNKYFNVIYYPIEIVKETIKSIENLE